MLSFLGTGTQSTHEVQSAGCVLLGHLKLCDSDQLLRLVLPFWPKNSILTLKKVVFFTQARSWTLILLGHFQLGMFCVSVVFICKQGCGLWGFLGDVVSGSECTFLPEAVC